MVKEMRITYSAGGASAESCSPVLAWLRSLAGLIGVRSGYDSAMRGMTLYDNDFQSDQE